MKKKLNIFCVLMLVLMAAELIMGIVMNYAESAQAFRQGWEEGRQSGGGRNGVEKSSRSSETFFSLCR